MTFSFGNGAGKFGFGQASNDDTEVEYEPGTLAGDLAEDIKDADSAYIARRKKEDKRREEATDSEYWFCVYFENRKEKQRFLAAIGAKRKLHGDKYLDGKQLAKLLKIEY